MDKSKESFIKRVSKGFNYAWNGVDPNYTKLTNGQHTYNYDLTGHKDLSNLFGTFGSKSYYKANENYKDYYVSIPYLNTVINLIASFTAQVDIKEIKVDTNEEIEYSPYIDLINNPNKWQNRDEFIKELTINILTQGAVVQSGNYFGRSYIKSNAYLYNLDGYNLKYPVIKNPYIYTTRDINDIEFIEVLSGVNRKIKYKDLNIVYDTINNSFWGSNGYSPNNFLCPVSRLQSATYDLQILLNSQDSLAFLSDAKMFGIVSRDHNGNQNPGASLGKNQKNDIEEKLSGRGSYGTKVNGKAIIASNENLKWIDMTVNAKKLLMIENQNNSKENMSALYHVPSDILNAVSGITRGSTYENQQFAEARFIEIVPKGITDKWLMSLMTKNKGYFEERGTKLVGSYDHMPSVSKLKGVEKQKGLSYKMDALNKVLDANSKLPDGELNIKKWMENEGYNDLL